MKKFIMTGAIIALISVAIGAFGAHALSDLLEKNNYTDVFETGVTYQMSHGLGIILVGILMSKNLFGPVKELKWAGILLTVGVIIFSGSLYTLSLTSIKILGAITPIGGVSFLLGWIFLIIATKKYAK